MTASQIITEIQALPPEDKARLVEFVHQLEEAEMPESFLQAVREMDEGRSIPIEESHFESPPV